MENFEFVDKHDYVLANKEFHEYLVDLAENAVLSQTYRSLNLHELTERVIAGPTLAAGNSSEEHRGIVESYERGDLAAARAAIIANIETGKQLAIEMIEALGGSDLSVGGRALPHCGRRQPRPLRVRAHPELLQRGSHADTGDHGGAEERLRRSSRSASA